MATTEKSIMQVVWSIVDEEQEGCSLCTSVVLLPIQYKYEHSTHTVTLLSHWGSEKLVLVGVRFLKNKIM